MNKLNGFRPHVLTVGVVGAPQISGDGKTVVWNQKVDDNVDIYRYQDGKIDRLSSDPRQDIHPTVNYDCSVITWARWSAVDPEDKTGNFDVVVWKDGQEQTVAATPANESDPQVSPDGKKIVWSNDVNGGGYKSVLQRLENGVVRDLTAESDNANFPTWAGNETLLWRAFDSNGSDLVRCQNGQAERVTSAPGHEIRPAGSDDGNVIVYQTLDEANNDDDLYRLDVRTGQSELISGLKKVDEDWPSLSADGKTVAWTNFDRRLFDTANTQIYAHENGQSKQLTFGPGLHGQTSISDDGNKIAFQWINSAFINNRAVVVLERE